jgi:hypothetical protein
MAKHKEVRTAAAAIEEMGGPTALARMLGMSGQRVWAWTRNGFPGDAKEDLQRFFASKGIRVADTAFNTRSLIRTAS